LGVGSAFHLFFPGQIRRHEDSISSPGLTDHEPATGSGQPLLVVDDEVGITKVVVPLLAHLGYSARVFTDPHRALEAFAAAPESFAALLTDLTMPSIDGLTLSKTIRALRTDIPIILMTGHIRLADVSVMRSCGIAHYLTKPFSIHTLAAKLREALPSPAPVDSSSSS
ncbi:MAG: response regulator, partial [Verrucomicrobia bacterium]